MHKHKPKPSHDQPAQDGHTMARRQNRGTSPFRYLRGMLAWLLVLLATVSMIAIGLLFASQLGAQEPYTGCVKYLGEWKSISSERSVHFGKAEIELVNNTNGDLVLREHFLRYSVVKENGAIVEHLRVHREAYTSPRILVPAKGRVSVVTPFSFSISKQTDVAKYLIEFVTESQGIVVFVVEECSGS